ncbi:hypothetical protein [Spiroplasma endosymbiont of Dasysyrphus albostriatus]|uniref:hypothetical protein n=2 Tax=Spiroplasma TaxID=2132 RepID=UPI0030D06CEB|nr:hypothetical protein [Spiroplasma ixodetis]
MKSVRLSNKCIRKGITMEKLKINNLDIELNINVIGKFLDKIEYPILIFDFETFRNLLHKKKNNSYAHDFEKIFSIALLIINKKEDLSVSNLQNKKLHLFVKTVIPQPNILNEDLKLVKHQQQFFKFLTNKLLKHNIKSLILLGARTEILMLKNYLSYHNDESKFKNKVSYFFQKHKIFDLYDIWNNDQVLNLPLYKKGLHLDVGATKKTSILIKNNNDYCKILKEQFSLTNNNIGRIIDQYFFNNICLLPSFTTQVANHNQNDVLIGAAILSLLYTFCDKY